MRTVFALVVAIAVLVAGLAGFRGWKSCHPSAAAAQIRIAEYGAYQYPWECAIFGRG